MTNKRAIERELIIRELEKRHSPQRESLVSFIEFFFKNELNREFEPNWHYNVIEEKLKEVMSGKCRRLIINIPPGSGKTELITKCFPVWALGHKPDMRFIVTGYSSTLTQEFGSQARDYYKSNTFQAVFPRRPAIRGDQDTKAEWKNHDGGIYFATGTGGGIPGKRANVFIIDDPIKPDEALSDVKRTAINNWYENTVASRLFNPLQDAIIIIMQRTHEDDLCGMLLEKMDNGTGEQWDTVILPAIATERDDHRAVGEPLQKNRYPIEALELIKKSYGEANFSTQYQQEPVNKDAQEFHEEFFQYWDTLPGGYHEIYTLVDPAFSKKENADYSAITTWGVFYPVEGELPHIILCDARRGRWDFPDLKRIAKEEYEYWEPECVIIEAKASGMPLTQELRSMGIPVQNYAPSRGNDKFTRVNSIAPILESGLVWAPDTRWAEEVIEECASFPVGENDDFVDTVTQALRRFREGGFIQHPEDFNDYVDGPPRVSNYYG